MGGRVVSISSNRTEDLSSEWELVATPSGTYNDAAQITSAAIEWANAKVPGTVAESLRTLNQWSLNGPARQFDAEDFWYRMRFPLSALLNEAAPNTPMTLKFGGLATIADVWLNGELLLQSDNMFCAHSARVEQKLHAHNELLIRFRALDALLAKKRPRPRWRTPMVSHQQLRYVRTTLLGRTAGWSPPTAVVGPWRAINLEHHSRIIVSDVRLATHATDSNGNVELRCSIDAATPAGKIVNVQLVIQYGEQEWRADCHVNEQAATAKVVVTDVQRWWPHTHGEPHLYAARLLITHIDSTLTTVELGSIGFRTVTLDTSNGDFAVSVNGCKIFCRGACWTPLDIVTLNGTREQYCSAIAQVRDCGMNMLRVGGTMTYETDDFYDECDRQGIMLWQDLMFANMDYPEDDAEFTKGAQREVTEQLSRWNGRPSITILCGNSEVEQQAAMWGATRDRWQPRLFHEVIPSIAKEYLSDVPYWPSSAHGGAFPHQGNVGTTSYYGVGAYMRDLEDARRSEVRFASECLAFANVPEQSGIEQMPNGLALKVHHPEWKMRTPRDLGAGWDFEDVRDFYLRKLFNVDPMQLRYADHDRYLEASRIVTGEVMAATFAEWRRSRSTCNGALVWFWRDLWAGAGWGIVDASGNPKAPYYFLKRALHPISVSMSDEGGNGVFVHLTNETAITLQGNLEIAFYRAGETPVGNNRRTVNISPRTTIEMPVASLFDGFMDLSYSYRFGPSAYDVVVATFTSDKGDVLPSAFYFPTGIETCVESDIGLTAISQVHASGDAELLLQSKRLASFVTVQTDGFIADDQYFHLAPGIQRRIYLRRSESARNLKGQVRALNSTTTYKITAAT